MTSPVEPAIEQVRELPASDLVLDQLRRILESPGFRNSKRYASVLRYIVEQTLIGKADHLKERTIGVDIFGRAPDYDTASDHVVRSAMSEVRKRLGQYYDATTSSSELQIELQPGSYIPQFRLAPVLIEEIPVQPDIVLPGETVQPAKGWIIGLVLATVALVLVGVLIRNASGRNDALQNFWSPVLASSRDVLVCVGNLERGDALGHTTSSPDLRLLSMGDFHHLPSQTIHVADAISLANIVSFLGTRNKRWKVVDQTDADFGDLRNGPAVLIGLMNNDWTERLMGKSRFRAEKIGPRKVVIRDTRNPQSDAWSMDYATPLLDIKRDYALILRVVDPTTDQTVVTAAGISVFGTMAASEFLTDSRSLGELSKIVPGWETRNLELVLSNEVVRAKSGRPHILAAQVW